MILILFSFSFSLFSVNQKLTLAHQQMTADYEKMRQEEADISAKLQERMSVAKSERIGHKRGVVDSLGVGGGGGGGFLADDETHLVNSFIGDYRTGNSRGVGFDKSFVICDNEIASEGDKRRLFGVIMNAKRRKEMLNLSAKHLKGIEQEGKGIEWCLKEGKNLTNNRKTQQRGRRGERRVSEPGFKGVGDVVGKKRNFRGLVRDILEQLPFALPSLQLHIILSLTMVLLTHQCPVASYFIAV